MRHRQHHLASVARHPDVDTAIGPLHFLVAEVKASADVEQGFVALNPRQLRLADDLLLLKQIENELRTG